MAGKYEPKKTPYLDTFHAVRCTVNIIKLQSVIIHSSNRSSRPEVFCKKGVLKSLAKFTEKRL